MEDIYFSVCLYFLCGIMFCGDFRVGFIGFGFFVYKFNYCFY